MAIVLYVVGVGAVVILVVQGSASLRGATTSPRASPTTPPRPVTRNTPLTAATGTVVFKDDFHDVHSGWDTASGDPDINYAFVNGTFVVVAKGAFLFYNPSPYSEPQQQLTVGVTATLDIHTPPDAGFGVDCTRGTGSSQTTYEFTADADSNWYVTRLTGPSSVTNVPTTLAQGTIRGKPAPGVIAVTSLGVCATLADGLTTRLAFFIDGSKVADLTDTPPAASPDGWLADLVTVGSESGPVTMTATHFEERDLSRSGP
ncbi:MAG TPA: hypothetical protein DCF65_14950 [Chloroflexi bacterium]|nr:hypothetical protein [Chloroflexota bacterium]